MFHPQFIQTQVEAYESKFNSGRPCLELRNAMHQFLKGGAIGGVGVSSFSPLGEKRSISSFDSVIPGKRLNAREYEEYEEPQQSKQPQHPKLEIIPSTSTTSSTTSISQPIKSPKSTKLTYKEELELFFKQMYKADRDLFHKVGLITPSGKVRPPVTYSPRNIRIWKEVLDEYCKVILEGAEVEMMELLNHLLQIRKLIYESPMLKTLDYDYLVMVEKAFVLSIVKNVSETENPDI